MLDVPALQTENCASGVVLDTFLCDASVEKHCCPSHSTPTHTTTAPDMHPHSRAGLTHPPCSLCMVPLSPHTSPPPLKQPHSSTLYVCPLTFHSLTLGFLLHRRLTEPTATSGSLETRFQSSSVWLLWNCDKTSAVFSQWLCLCDQCEGNCCTIQAPKLHLRSLHTPFLKSCI